MKKLKLALSVVCCGLVLNSKAQSSLPSDYITKHSYQEKTEVIYELVEDSTRNCLSLQELSQYHSYWTIKDIVDLVDQDGETHREEVYVEEEFVRDDWMTGYGRVYSGPNYTDVFSLENELVYRKTNDYDSLADAPMIESEALTYGLTFFSDSTLTETQQYFTEMGITSSITGSILTASTPTLSLVYDDITKSSNSTAYDSSGLKVAEHSRTFTDNNDGKYFPHTDITIEWIRTKNGCCVRKTTIVTRTRFEFTTHPDYEQQTDLEAKEHNTIFGQRGEAQFFVNQIVGQNAFMVSHKTSRFKKISISAYDMSGKLVLETNTTTNQPIKFPETTQTGMYLIHISYRGTLRPESCKIILPSTNNRL